MLSQNFPPATETMEAVVNGIIDTLGTVGGRDRKLGVIVGPLSFDETDDQIRRLMRQTFLIALNKKIAVGFHVDDSMFCGRLTELAKPENIEWTNWTGNLSTGRRLEWSSTPTKIVPQLCLNSPAVEAEVRKRASLIGEECVDGMKLLKKHGLSDLFAGVIAGWETQIGRDFDSGKDLGYHALSNEGYSASNPPINLDEARVKVVGKFVDLWADSLARAGMPDNKIYAHVAFVSRTSYDMARFSDPSKFPNSYLETVNFTPPSAAFGPHHRPGFSTYPQFGHVEQVQAEVGRHGHSSWASCEGTAVDPGAAEKGDPGGPMERYLGNQFNRGAVLVNVFGWGVGEASNPFRRVAEGRSAVAAYRKFLNGEKLQSDPDSELPSSTFFDKMRLLRNGLPGYIAKFGAEKIATRYRAFVQAMAKQRFEEAERNVDQILVVIKEPQSKKA